MTRAIALTLAAGLVLVGGILVAHRAHADDKPTQLSPLDAARLENALLKTQAAERSCVDAHKAVEPEAKEAQAILDRAKITPLELFGDPQRGVRPTVTIDFKSGAIRREPPKK